jgi:hypothetical protein
MKNSMQFLKDSFINLKETVGLNPAQINVLQYCINMVDLATPMYKKELRPSNKKYESEPTCYCNHCDHQNSLFVSEPGYDLIETRPKDGIMCDFITNKKRYYTGEFILKEDLFLLEDGKTFFHAEELIGWKKSFAKNNKYE